MPATYTDWFAKKMCIGKRNRARQTWLSILPVLPYLILTLTAGGPHNHRLVRQCLDKRAAEVCRAGLTALQADSDATEGRCVACDWLAQTSAQYCSALLVPQSVCLETPQLAPAIHPVVSTPLPHSSRAPPLV
jgi:hypothetical protein